MRVFWSLILVLFLAGCAGTPQSREAGGTMEVSVLGAEATPEGLRLYAAAEKKAEDLPSSCQGTGAVPAAAVEALSRDGSQVVSCAHVEHLLLAQSAAGRLPELLSYAFQDPLQSTETQLWVVREKDLSEVFSPKRDPARRMDVLKAVGQDRQGFCPVTLREAAAALENGEPVLLPVLEQREAGLAYAGSVLCREGRLTLWFTEEDSLGVRLLTGQRIHWTAGLGEQAVSLQSAGCRVVPIWSGEKLAGLTVRCQLEGVRTGGWTADNTDLAPLEQQTAEEIQRALARLQRNGEGRLLMANAGLRSPWRWRTLRRQWEEAFPGLPAGVEVAITAATD